MIQYHDVQFQAVRVANVVVSLCCHVLLMNFCSCWSLICSVGTGGQK